MKAETLKTEQPCTLHGAIMSFVSGVGYDNEEVVDLQTAKCIKANGFNKPTHYYYIDGNVPYVENGLKRVKMNKRRMNHNKDDDFIYSAPTKSECVRWVNSL
jgi:hypothetical protein